MYNKSLFNRTPFNLSGDETPGFYATVQSEYRIAVSIIKVRLGMGPVTMGSDFETKAGWLWLYAPIAPTQFDTLYQLTANFTALIPLGRITTGMGAGMAVSMHARIPLCKIRLQSESEMSATLWAAVPFRPVSLRTESNLQGCLGLKVPLDALTLQTRFTFYGLLSAGMPLPKITLHSEYKTQAKAVRTSETEEIVLNGLNLKPGQRLIIDTDTLEISVDDEIRVDCWVTGGTFFQFKNGNNTLTFSDNASRRKLMATVLWADRYL